MKNALTNCRSPGSPSNKTVSGDEKQQNTELSAEGSENILELDPEPELDIYGHLEYDLGDEDYVGAALIKICMPQPAEGEWEMKVAFSTFDSEMSTGIGESPSSELMQGVSFSLLKIDKSAGTLPAEGVSEQAEPTRPLTNHLSENHAQVAAYTKEPTRPLYKSGAISLEQYRCAV
ncbi:hypothetical protein SAY87_000385 [Trapa incisa]|uniref:Uncharacterized protein n=1 Tax=Trapa incisa TaxID=236973 RepID=A0AAN7GIG9_9MYRT|nr:hypothetical protein SAY87_000385 [Trapa incisa]